MHADARGRVLGRVDVAGVLVEPEVVRVRGRAVHGDLDEVGAGLPREDGAPVYQVLRLRFAERVDDVPHVPRDRLRGRQLPLDAPGARQQPLVLFRRRVERRDDGPGRRAIDRGVRRAVLQRGIVPVWKSNLTHPTPSTQR